MIPIYLLNLIGDSGCLTTCDTPLFLLLEVGGLYIYSIQYVNTLMTLLRSVLANLVLQLYEMIHDLLEV